jgi:hypothetical protein
LVRPEVTTRECVPNRLSCCDPCRGGGLHARYGLSTGKATESLVSLFQTRLTGGYSLPVRDLIE